MSEYSSGDGLSKRCSNCGQEIRIVVEYSVDHDSDFYLSLIAMCGCEKASPKATELDGITFEGELPNGWN